MLNSMGILSMPFACMHPFRALKTRLQDINRLRGSIPVQILLKISLMVCVQLLGNPYTRMEGIHSDLLGHLQSESNSITAI